LTAEACKKSEPAVASLKVNPGVCGFNCTIDIHHVEKRVVRVVINGSECKQIQRLSAAIDQFTLKELFTPLTRNPVYKAAEKSGCHSSCVIPAAILKAVEAAMGMAIAKDVALVFNPVERGVE
jgi:hypothetical protein